ncbi:hypothetical protein IW146_010534, partial [Coemansia sp. RSA 922]
MTVELHPLPLSQLSSDLVDSAAAGATSGLVPCVSQDDADLNKSSDMVCGGSTEEHRQQVKQSIMTLERSGYRLRSIDVPSKSILLGFDGSVHASDEIVAPAQPNESVEPATEQPAIVHAIVGTFTLDISSYVLVVTDSRCRGTIADSQIYEATAVAALPLSS